VKLEVAKWGEYSQQMADVCHASTAAREHWGTRPERYAVEDEIMQALQGNLNTLQQLTEQVATHVAGLEAVDAQATELCSEGPEELTSKADGLRVDEVASRIKSGKGEEQFERSALPAEAWVEHVQDVLDRHAEFIEKAASMRAGSEELLSYATGRERECREAMEGLLQAREEFWAALIMELNDKISEVQDALLELKLLGDKVSVKIKKLQQSLDLAKTKLAKRLSRPDLEAKNDQAEEALTAEVEQLQSSLQQLNDHLAEMNKEKAQLEAQLTALQEELQDTVTAQSIDTSIKATMHRAFKRSAIAKLHITLMPPLEQPGWNRHCCPPEGELIHDATSSAGTTVHAPTPNSATPVRYVDSPFNGTKVPHLSPTR